MRKYAIYLKPDRLKVKGIHKLINLSHGEKSISFIRGKDNIVKEADKLTVLFSDLNKPVKLLNGQNFKKGPTPSQLAKDFQLEIVEVEVEEPEKNINNHQAFEGSMRKYAIYLKPDCLRVKGIHKLINLSHGEKSISFIRGKDNIVKEADKLTVLFSDLNKPVKLLNGQNFKKGPTPSQLSKDFQVELFEVEVKQPERKQERRQSFTLGQRINHSIISIQTLIENLPEEINVSFLRTAVKDLSRLKLQIEVMQNNATQNTPPPPTSNFNQGVSQGTSQRAGRMQERESFSSGFFNSEVRAGIHAKKR